MRALSKRKGKVFHSFIPDRVFVSFLPLPKAGTNVEESCSVFSCIMNDYRELTVLLVSFHIYSKCKKMQTRKNSRFGYF